jgi:CTP synthase (UTP-ammonia lyase)
MVRALLKEFLVGAVMRIVRIGIIGDYDARKTTHVATTLGLSHAAEVLKEPLETVWLATDLPQDFSQFDGLLCSPGSPYQSMLGALAGIRYARENRVPFIGTCGGFQHLIIEYARNIMGFVEASHAESDPCASCLFITRLRCSPAGKTMEVALQTGCAAALACGATRSMERFYCNFGLNPEYRSELEQHGLQITGSDANGEARIVELPGHPFFVGTLFVPQARSIAGSPHPLILEFCRSAVLFATNRLEPVRG